MNKTVVLKFVEAINQQNTSLIIEMMAEEFIFIDTYGDIKDKEHMKTGWQGYFDWFPDYEIIVDDYIENEDFSIILGQASGSYLGKTDKFWKFPAAWKVIVENQQIKVWQVFCDSKKQLDSMG